MTRQTKAATKSEMIRDMRSAEQMPALQFTLESQNRRDYSLWREIIRHRGTETQRSAPNSERRLRISFFKVKLEAGQGVEARLRVSVSLWLFRLFGKKCRS